MNNKKLIIVVLLVFMLPLIQTKAETPLEDLTEIIPSGQLLDLYKNSSEIPIWVNLTAEMDYILEITWVLEFTSNTIDIDSFGTNGALANGIQVFYDGRPNSAKITSLADFARLSYDFKVISDTVGEKTNLMIVRWRIDDIVRPNGLKYGSGHTWQVYINDDITAHCDMFTVAVKGFRTIEHGIRVKETWIDDVSNFDSITDYFLCFLLLPLILMESSSELTFWFGVGLLIIEICVVLGLLKHFVEGMIL